MAIFSAVQEREHWRVKIVWSNGAAHYFGSFTSKQDALAWIDTHQWLTLPVATENPNAEQ